MTEKFGYRLDHSTFMDITTIYGNQRAKYILRVDDPRPGHCLRTCLTLLDIKWKGDYLYCYSNDMIESNFTITENEATLHVTYDRETNG